MKILVVGHLCLDVIHPAEGPDVESYGGIYYAVATLASLLGTTDTVIPVFGVNRADYPALIDHLKRFPNVDPSGIFKVDAPTNTVHLFYKDSEHRIECSKDIAAPIPYAKIRRYLSVDAVLVNMISGFDIALETLDHIRLAIRSHDIPLLFDYHSLTLGVKANHERFRRPVEEWRRWAFMDDIVQLNEEEIRGLAVERLTEEQAAGHLLTLGVKGVVVTRGEHGATLYYSVHKKMMRTDFAGVPTATPRDPTGCGDVFGAAMIFRYATTRNLIAATDYANRVASTKVQYVGVDGLQNLRDTTAVA